MPASQYQSGAAHPARLTRSEYQSIDPPMKKQQAFINMTTSINSSIREDENGKQS